jgi:hypothetical protein
MYELKTSAAEHQHHLLCEDFFVDVPLLAESLLTHVKNFVKRICQLANVKLIKSP